MTWEALNAISTAVSALVVTVAAVAALLQLKHLRRTSQVESYLELLGALGSPEMVAARRYVESLDPTDPAVLEAAMMPTIDHRIIAVGVHYQMATRLFNQRILDERLFQIYIGTAPLVWRALRPIAHAIRARTGATYWIDIEYFVWRTSRDKPLPRMLKRDYPSDFMKESGLGALPMASGIHATD